MKAVLITTTGEVTIEELGEPLHQYTRPILGGLVEVVHPIRLKRPYDMLVNESGLLQDLDLNTVGSFLYGTDTHDAPIGGNVLIMKEAVVNSLGEHNIVGMNRFEAQYYKMVMTDLYQDLKGPYTDAEET